MYVFQHCGMMTGLTPNTEYMVSVYGIDTYMRISPPEERRFNSEGQPTIPPMTATPLGSSLLYVSVPTYGATNVPLLQAWVVEEGTEPGCSAADTSHPNLRIVGEQRFVEVSADYLRRHNYVAGYNHRIVSLYDVPEGSTVVLCARWYDREAPSWARDTPTDQKSMVVMSPDLISPIVTLERLNLTNAVSADAIHMTASSQWGWVCGEARAPGRGRERRGRRGGRRGVVPRQRGGHHPARRGRDAREHRDQHRGRLREPHHDAAGVPADRPVRVRRRVRAPRAAHLHRLPADREDGLGHVRVELRASARPRRGRRPSAPPTSW